MIIDAHVHLPVGEQFSDMASKKEKLLDEMKKNHVDKCIVIADSWPDSEIGTTEELVSLFLRTKNANVFVVGGISPIKNFDETFEKLLQYALHKQIVGSKLYTGHESLYLTDNKLKDVYALAIKYNLPLLFHSAWDNIDFGNVDVAESILKQFPELQLVCCHCWYPEIRKCRHLLKYPNIAFDLSSIADNADILDNIRSEAKLLIEGVPERVIFGSDSFGYSMIEHIKFIKSLKLTASLSKKLCLTMQQEFIRKILRCLNRLMIKS